MPDLIRHFFALVEREGLPAKQLDQAALERLKRHRWPGNVRELENLARRLAALYPQETISAAVIDAELSQPAMVTTERRARGEEGSRRCGRAASRGLFCRLRRRLAAAGPLSPGAARDRASSLSATLAATRGNQIRAADLLGVNRNTLRKKIRDLDIQVFRGAG